MRAGKIRNSFTQQFLFAVTQDFTDPAVDHLDPGLGVERDDHDPGDVEIALRLLAGLLQRRFSLLAFGDVLDHGDEIVDLTVRIAHALDVDVGVHQAAVLADKRLSML